jgi:hypothetical protein
LREHDDQETSPRGPSIVRVSEGSSEGDFGGVFARARIDNKVLSVFQAFFMVEEL